MDEFGPGEGGPGGPGDGASAVSSIHGIEAAMANRITSLHGIEAGLGFFISTHGPEVGYPHFITSLHGIEVELANVITSLHGPEVAMANTITSLHGIRVASASTFLSLHGIRAEMLPGDYGGGFEDPGDGSGDMYPEQPAEPLSTWLPPTLQVEADNIAQLFRLYGIQLILVGVGDGSWDLTPYVRSYEITHKRNEPLDFVFELADDDRRFIPLGGDLSDYLRGDSISDEYAVRRYFQFKIFSQGLVWEAPRLIQLEKQWAFGSGVPLVTISGTDYSELLLGEALSFDDYVSSSAKIWRAKEIIIDLLRKFGCSSFSLDFEDYEVPRFPPKGATPLDWIKQILWVRQVEWYWDRDTFRAHDRYSSGSVILRDIYHMKNARFRQSTLELKNEFVIRKTAASSDILLEFEYWTPDVPGFVGGEEGLSFTASRNCKIVIEDIVAGTLVGITWWAGDTPVTTSPASLRYIGNTPVDKVVMTYLPGSSFPSGIKAHIKGYIEGEAADGDYYPPGVAKAFTVTVKDSANQAIYGIRREPTPQDATYVPDVETAHELGLALIDESIRNLNQCSWEGVLFPMLMPGMQATIYATMAGYAAGGAYYVESVTKHGTPEEHRMTVETTHFES